MSRNVPPVGALVEYGRDGMNAGPGRYRVTAYIKAVAVDVLTEDEILDLCCGIELPVKDRPKRTMYYWCKADEATHLSLSGVCGARAPIDEVKVTGMVPWSQEQLKSAQMHADRLAEERSEFPLGS